MREHRVGGAALVGAALLSVGVVAGCAGEDPAAQPPAPVATSTPLAEMSTATTGPTVDLHLAVSGSARVGEPLEQVEQLGAAEVELEVASLAGGEVMVSSDRAGQPAFRLPAFEDATNPPRAALRVTPVGDALTPGDRDFTMSVEVRLDETSTGSPVDNGDNLLQRGLASDESQFKLEMDSRRPLCRIQGQEGMLEVRLQERVAPRVWYRLSCSRSGDLVTLTATELTGGAQPVVLTAEAIGPTGTVAWEDKNPPLSVGGKLAANGQLIRSATDQFNGLVANPILSIID